MADKLSGKKVALLATDGDPPAFRDKLVEEICGGRHEEQALQTAGSGAPQ